MADEWRVSVTLSKRSRAEEDSPWTTAMSTLRSRIGSDIRVSQTPRRVFLYAASAHSAMQVEQVARDVLTEHAVSAEVRCGQWNPIKQAWTSHEELMNAERKKSAATGRAAWQVRVEPPSHHELKALAQRLEAEGFSVVRRWRYLIAGAGCEDDAHALAGQIRGYSSAGTRMRVQPGVYDVPPVRAWVPLGDGVAEIRIWI
jgi:hypothetical protein